MNIRIEPLRSPTSSRLHRQGNNAFRGGFSKNAPPPPPTPHESRQGNFTFTKIVETTHWYRELRRLAIPSQLSPDHSNLFASVRKCQRQKPSDSVSAVSGKYAGEFCNAVCHAMLSPTALAAGVTNYGFPCAGSRSLVTITCTCAQTRLLCGHPA